MAFEFKVTHGEPRDRRGRPQRWCGPAALSAVTGYTAEVCAAWIMDRREDPHHHQTKGVFHSEMWHALRALGFDFEVHSIEVGHIPTVRGFVEGLPNHRGDYYGAQVGWGDRLIIHVRDHYLASYQGLVVDNRVEAPCRPRDMLGRQQRVKGFWIVRQVKRWSTEPWPAKGRSKRWERAAKARRRSW